VGQPVDGLFVVCTIGLGYGDVALFVITVRFDSGVEVGGNVGSTTVGGVVILVVGITLGIVP
jgi:hypothetical protein